MKHESVIASHKKIGLLVLTLIVIRREWQGGTTEWLIELLSRQATIVQSNVEPIVP